MRRKTLEVKATFRGWLKFTMKFRASAVPHKLAEIWKREACWDDE